MKGISSPPSSAGCELRNDTVLDTNLSVANTFLDLDLSAYVGARSVLCYLEVETQIIAKFAGRTKGVGAYAPATLMASAHVSCLQLGELHIGMLIVFTDSDGIIEICSDDGDEVFTVILRAIVR
ncbi:hypothetical protein LCGC14_0840750 [marine sediment metagenome]|uniref:Uncharacterized protein n=1 Tax=marine sediment metagenome TaxID=412755 RepID=A0A0F9PYJ2_9ZZZZ